MAILHRINSVLVPNNEEQASLFAMDRAYLEEIRKCSFCGNSHPVAYWRGARTIATCLTCATHTIPKLVADAFVGAAPIGMAPTKVQDYLRSFHVEFWCAVAIAMEQKLKRTEGEP